MTTRFYDGDSSNNRYCWDDETLIKSKTNNDQDGVGILKDYQKNWIILRR
mgnify:CR=1 FL=1